MNAVAAARNSSFTSFQLLEANILLHVNILLYLPFSFREIWTLITKYKCQNSDFYCLDLFNNLLCLLTILILGGQLISDTLRLFFLSTLTNYLQLHTSHLQWNPALKQPESDFPKYPTTPQRIRWDCIHECLRGRITNSPTQHKLMKLNIPTSGCLWILRVF